MPLKTTEAETIKDSDIQMDCTVEQIAVGLLPHVARIINETGLLGDYNDGDAYLAETGDVLCIKGRRGIPTHVHQKVQEDEYVRISHISTDDGHPYIEVRVN